MVFKQKLPYFGHMLKSTGSVEKDLMCGRTMRMGRQRMRWMVGSYKQHGEKSRRTVGINIG